MAEIREEILVDLKIEKGDNEKQVDSLTKSIISLQKANKDLATNNKELAKTGQENSKEYIENSKQIELNKQKITEASASRKGLIQALTAEDNSIKGLQVRNAELIKQRNLVNTSTDEGKRKIAEINAEIDKNNKTIQTNVSALEKQKINIGNYASALDGVVPGLSGFIRGMQGMTTAALTFIATPIGAIIGAIGLALGALIAYFKGSEEGQDRLNVIMQVGGAIMGKIMDVVRDLGEAIFNAFTNPKQALEDFVDFLKENIQNRVEGLLELFPALGKAISLAFKGEFAEAGRVAFDAVAKVSTGVADASAKIAGLTQEIVNLTSKALDEGQRVAQLQKEIRAAERQFQLDSADTAIKVAKLREEAVRQEGDVKIKTIQQAIDLEKKLADQGIQIAKEKFRLAELEASIADNDIAANDALIKAQVNLKNAELERYTSTLRFEKQLESARDEQRRLDETSAKERTARAKEFAEEEKRIKKELADAEKEQFENNSQFLKDKHTEELNLLKEKYLNEEIAKEEFEQRITELELEALEIRKGFLEANGQDILAIESSIIDAKIKLKDREIAAEKKKTDTQKKLEADRLANTQRTLSAGTTLFKQNTEAYKLIASSQAAIDTYAAANAALRNPPGPPTTIPLMLLTIARGLFNVAKINGIQFARGGIAYTGGVLRGPTHEQGGIPFAVGGRVGFEAEGGEAIINRRSTALFRPLLSRINQAGGGVAFAAGGTIGGEQTRIAAQNANQVIDVRQLAGLINNVQPVLVLEDFETKKGSVDDVQRRAQVI